MTSLRPPEGEAKMDLKSFGRNFKSIIPMQTEGSFKNKILGIVKTMKSYPKWAMEDDISILGMENLKSLVLRERVVDIHFAAKVKEQIYIVLP
ncbi:hypothetical protein D8674_011730 [Pyrus ussuriensis x Pyrus communis]|uniref:Uncharacterized protein n=1 Tax=Pyrus ussuriensis x Pyrus communis TaxID=2448454 RepID=A0A5N5G562_9ROSA|nr:hypothetical protein D8674_011730 [Pyrus ussuriensis x Pyrus communis]